MKKIESYFYVRMPGIVAVSPDGTPLPRKRDTVMLVITEIKGDAPQWKQAWMGGRLFSVSAIPVKGSSLAVGSRMNDQKEVKWKASKGNTLWQLELMPIDKFQTPPQAVKSNEILLTGNFRKKIFYQKVKQPIELASPLYQ